MKKIKTLLLLIFILTLANVTAQTKKTTPKKAKPEIDALYENYKNSNIITLYTSNGEIYGHVLIEKNSDDKPVSVKISGTSSSKTAISEFIRNTIDMKIKQGYKTTENPQGRRVDEGLGFTFKKDLSFHLVMKKGNMYFRADAGCCVSYGTGYSWEIETGDSSRKGGKEAKDFKF
jgi:hypothetical protein